MIIYKITNKVNGKIYIGKTKNDSEDYYGSGVIIKAAIKKYGLENFEKEVLEKVNNLQELNKREIYWIAEYNSTNKKIGYNIGKGGDGGDLFTNNPRKEEIRKKQTERKGQKNGMFGRKHKIESIKKMSENKKGQGKGKTPWNKGLTKNDFSDTHIENIKKNGKDNVLSYKYIAISPKKKETVLYGYAEFVEFSKKIALMLLQLDGTQTKV
jgi:group I intron endonuclease